MFVIDLYLTNNTLHHLYMLVCDCMSKCHCASVWQIQQQASNFAGE